jgi:dTMP kinase
MTVIRGPFLTATIAPILLGSAIAYKQFGAFDWSIFWLVLLGGIFAHIATNNLDDYFDHKSKEKFDKNTDTLLYLAARNEHIINKLKPEILKKKIIICDRFTDSTTAYQVYGKGVNKHLVDNVHKHILDNIKPDLTFILKVKISAALRRLKKRGKKNRYDNFSNNFYIKAQKAFIKMAKKNKARFVVLDNSKDTKETEIINLEKFNKLLNK